MLVNIIRIVGKKQKSIYKILDYISSENRIIDYNKIIPLSNVGDEEEEILKWGEPLNSQIEAFKIDKKELLIKLRTLVNPPLKIIKQLSLFPEIDEIIVSFANLDITSESGLFYIRKGGVMQKISFEENSQESKEFSLKLIHQLEKSSNKIYFASNSNT